MVLFVMHLTLVAVCAAIGCALIIAERSENSKNSVPEPRPGTKSDRPRFFSVLPAGTLKLGSVI